MNGLIICKPYKDLKILSEIKYVDDWPQVIAIYMCDSDYRRNRNPCVLLLFYTTKWKDKGYVEEMFVMDQADSTGWFVYS